MTLVKRIDLGTKEILVWEEPVYWAQMRYKNGRPIDSGESRQWSVWAALVSLRAKIAKRRDNQKNRKNWKLFDGLRQQITDILDKEAADDKT